MNNQLNTPVLYIIFNRLDTVKRTFPVIAAQKPARLFIAADGPRVSREGEAEKCREVRNFVLSNINWNCDVQTLFREENLGCGENVHRAITWFFDNVEQGIILEDDCLPDPSFFAYCETLLDYYKNDERIMHIAGDNPLIQCKNWPYSYYYARLMHCWGWASWKRAWKKYEFVLSDVTKTLSDNAYFKNRKVREHYEYIFRGFEKKPFITDTWDYQWTYAVFKANGICINPAKNLVTNIGFDGEGAHFNNNGHGFSRPSFPVSQICHPPKVEVTEKYVRQLDKKVFGITKRHPLRFAKHCVIMAGIAMLKTVGLYERVKKWYNS